MTLGKDVTFRLLFLLCLIVFLVISITVFKRPFLSLEKESHYHLIHVHGTMKSPNGNDDDGVYHGNRLHSQNAFHDMNMRHKVTTIYNNNGDNHDDDPNGPKDDRDHHNDTSVPLVQDHQTLTLNNTPYRPDLSNGTTSVPVSIYKYHWYSLMPAAFFFFYLFYIKPGLVQESSTFRIIERILYLIRFAKTHTTVLLCLAVIFAALFLYTMFRFIYYSVYGCRFVYLDIISIMRAIVGRLWAIFGHKT